VRRGRPRAQKRHLSDIKSGIKPGNKPQKLSETGEKGGEKPAQRAGRHKGEREALFATGFPLLSPKVLGGLSASFTPPL